MVDHILVEAKYKTLRDKSSSARFAAELGMEQYWRLSNFYNDRYLELYVLLRIYLVEVRDLP